MVERGRHHGADHRGGDVGRLQPDMGEQRLQPDAVFVRRALRLGADAPDAAPLAPVMHGEDDVRVAGIDDEQHRLSAPRRSGSRPSDRRWMPPAPCSSRLPSSSSPAKVPASSARRSARRAGCRADARARARPRAPRRSPRPGGRAANGASRSSSVAATASGAATPPRCVSAATRRPGTTGALCRLAPKPITSQSSRTARVAPRCRSGCRRACARRAARHSAISAAAPRGPRSRSPAPRRARRRRAAPSARPRPHSPAGRSSTESRDCPAAIPSRGRGCRAPGLPPREHGKPLRLAGARERDAEIGCRFERLVLAETPGRSPEQHFRRRLRRSHERAGEDEEQGGEQRGAGGDEGQRGRRAVERLLRRDRNRSP